MPTPSSGAASKAPPTVSADEDFGGWTSASVPQTPAAGPGTSHGSKLAGGGGGFGGSDDLFSNVWE